MVYTIDKEWGHEDSVPAKAPEDFLHTSYSTPSQKHTLASTIHNRRRRQVADKITSIERLETFSINPQSHSFSQSYGSVLPTSLTYFNLWQEAVNLGDLMRLSVRTKLLAYFAREWWILSNIVRRKNLHRRNNSYSPQRYHTWWKCSLFMLAEGLQTVRIAYLRILPAAKIYVCTRFLWLCANASNIKSNILYRRLKLLSERILS